MVLNFLPLLQVVFCCCVLFSYCRSNCKSCTYTCRCNLWGIEISRVCYRSCLHFPHHADEHTLLYTHIQGFNFCSALWRWWSCLWWSWISSISRIGYLCLNHRIIRTSPTSPGKRNNLVWGQVLLISSPTEFIRRFTEIWWWSSWLLCILVQVQTVYLREFSLICYIFATFPNAP